MQIVRSLIQTSFRTEQHNTALLRQHHIFTSLKIYDVTYPRILTECSRFLFRWRACGDVSSEIAER